MQYLLIIRLLLLLFNAVIISSGQLRRDHKKSNSNRNNIKYEYTNDEKFDDDFNKCKRTSVEGLSQRSTSPRIPLYALQSEFNYDTSEITNSVQNETNNEEFKGRKPFKIASEMKIQPLIGETNNPPNIPRKTDRKFPLNFPSYKNNKSVDNVRSNDESCDDSDINDEKNLDEIKSDACKKIINNLFTDNSDEGIDFNVNELDYNIPNKSVRLSGVNTFVKLGGVKKSHNKIFKDVNMSLKPKLNESTDNPVPLKAVSEKDFISHSSRNDALHDAAFHQLHNMKIVQSYHPQIDDIGGSNETTTHDEGDVTTSGNLEKTTSNIFMGDYLDNDFPPINAIKLKKKKNFVYKDLNCILKTNVNTQESVLYCYRKRPMEDRINSPRVMIGMPMPFGLPMPELPPIRPQLRRIPQYKPVIVLNVPPPPNPANIISQPHPFNALKLNNIGFMML